MAEMRYLAVAYPPSSVRTCHSPVPVEYFRFNDYRVKERVLTQIERPVNMLEVASEFLVARKSF